MKSISPIFLLILVNEPHLTLSAHGNKVQLVKWHPLAQDILISMAFDQSVKIWNLNDPAQPQMELEVRICVFLGLFLLKV